MSDQPRPRPVYEVEHSARQAAVLSLPGVLNAVLGRWRILVGVPALLLLIIGPVLLLRDRQYEATLSFVPQADTGLRGGLMSGVAAQFGVDIGGGSNTDNPAFFVELVESTGILRRLIDEPIPVPTPGGETRESSVAELLGRPEPEGMAGRRELIGAVRTRVDAGVDRTTGMVRVTVRAPRPEYAVALANRVLSLLRSFNAESRRSKATAEREFLQARVDEAVRDLGMAEDAQRVFMDRNATWEESPTLRMEAGRLQRDVALKQQVFTSLSQALEDAKIEEIRTTPTLTVVDEPRDTVKPVARRTVYWLVITLLTGATVSIALIFVIDFLGREFERHPDDAAHLRHTLRGWRRRENSERPLRG